ncbi:MAG: type II secretion system GspH family protein [Fusobacterium sp.]|nr:type II secretion system GspH family protein [Fusobacterium sp.]
MTKRFAFTLAEVLIALAIIGVVAAMTIPTFMANTAGAQFRTGFKKGITVLTQAASANYATEGYDFSGTNGYAGGGATPTNQFDNGGTDENGSATALPEGAEATIIGFNTASSAELDTTSDLHPETPSLFHLFQNNLNMKNSNESVNYAVMPSDALLSCAGNANVTTINYSVPGSSGTSATLPADLESRLGAASPIQGSGGLANFCDGRTLAQGGFNHGRMFTLEDGMTFTYDGAQAYCSESNPCYGYLDVNGSAGPNRVIACSEEVTGGKANKDGWISTYGRNANAGMLLADCTVESKDITDIYPVLFYGSTVKPASIAAKSVLYSKKSNQTDSAGAASTTP